MIRLNQHPQEGSEELIKDEYNQYLETNLEDNEGKRKALKEIEHGNKKK